MRDRILFYRDYRNFSGGHLKVRDYFNHAKFSSRYRPEIYLTPQSRSVHPWLGEYIVNQYKPETASVIFIAGMDWIALSPYPNIEDRIPVVNLIQGFRHVLPSKPLFGFLHRYAIRICVSGEVAAALEATSICNGPIHIIPNGIDADLLPKTKILSSDLIFIAGLKQPTLALALYERLQAKGYTVKCQTSQISRDDFLSQMALAKVAILLPLPNEGFYLPALEAMAMGIAVICPDCVGNRSFCIDRVTALTPALELDSIEAAVTDVMEHPDLARALAGRGKEMSLRHHIRAERERFLEILDEINPA